ncbi:MAG: ABC transporter permease subunit [Deltaproteobacteria bacterium]|nr:ABC transporter permease subunit [Deltaproteobacteria bacterium]
MRNAIAIFLKEVRIYFTTPVAYVAFTVFTIVSSFLFLRLLGSFQRNVLLHTQRNPGLLKYMNFTDQVLGPLIHNIAVVLVFIVPFISMRLIAEERRSGSYELLMSNPVTPAQITFGKYLSALLVLATMMLLVLVYPLLVSAYAEVGHVAWETVLSGLLGLFLMGAAFVAIGLFFSAVTRSQIVAAALTFCTLLMLWMVGWAAVDNTGLTREVLNGLSAIEHIRNFTVGRLDLRDLVYYASWMVFGLFLTHRALEAQRWR